VSRTPVPTERKRLLGNPGKRALPATVAVLPAIDEPPEPPRPLGPEGRKMWTRVWEYGRAWVAPGSDLDFVLMLCESMDERVMLRVAVLRGTGDWRDRVALRNLDEQITNMLARLAFTPTDRTKLGFAEVQRASALESLLIRRRQA
jgi:hypothetical protein